MRPREKGALGGAAVGAGAGAVLGSTVGKAGAGAAVGAGTGAVAGALIAEGDDDYETKKRKQEAIMKQQELELQKQDRRIEDLKRQQYHNERLKQYDQQRRVE